MEAAAWSETPCLLHATTTLLVTTAFAFGICFAFFKVLVSFYNSSFNFFCGFLMF